MSIEQMAAEYVALAKQAMEYFRDNTVRVLLVEDNPMDIEVVRAQLASIQDTTGRKYIVETATRIEDARLAISERRHNIVILDWHMGDGEHTGLDLARQLHADGVQFPFIILTGREADYTEAVGEDCMGWISKLTTDASALDAALIHAVKNWYSRSGMKVSSHD